MSGIRVRLATRDDNDALCALMRDVHLDGAVRIAQERDPDFFAFARAHEPGVPETFVACDGEGGPVVGCGTLVVRDAWWPDGSRGRVGYICDLRVRPAYRGARVMPILGRDSLERAREVHRVEVCLSAIMDANARVRRAALDRGARRREQPVSRPMTPYRMVSVQTAWTRPPPRGVVVERAGPADVEELSGFLAQRERGKTFGYVIDRKVLETRLRAWPGLRVEDFRIVRGGDGRIAACGAPWDAHPVKRVRAVAYGAPLRAYRAGYGALARLRGWTPLPPAGEHLRFATLSHLEADDPRLLRALVLDALEDARRKRLHFLNVMVAEDAWLRPAFRGLLATSARLTLHTTTLAGSPWSDHDFRTRRPGFEMALA